MAVKIRYISRRLEQSPDDKSYVNNNDNNKRVMQRMYRKCVQIWWDVSL